MRPAWDDHLDLFTMLFSSLGAQLSGHAPRSNTIHAHHAPFLPTPFLRHLQEGDQFMEEGISHHHHVLCQGVDECQEASARGPK